jgi:hypothetical protein
MPNVGTGGHIDRCPTHCGQLASNSIHTIKLLTLQNDIAIAVIHMSNVLTFPAATLLAGNLRGGHEVYAQSWNVEDRRQKYRASWAPSEQEIALTVHSMLLTPS